MQQHIFDPLGMSSSTFQISKHPDLAARRAALGFRAAPAKPDEEPARTLRSIFEDRAPPNQPLGAGPDQAPINPEIEMGGGGLFTTATDYGKFLGALISRDSRVLKPQTIEELLKPQLDDPKHFQAFVEGPMHDNISPEFPRGIPVNYSLGGAVNMEDFPRKRRKGSMMWSGLTNPRWVC